MEVTMTKVVVLGHGGYGTAIKNNLAMLLGELEGFYYIDFNPEHNVDDLNEEIHKIISDDLDQDVLFACDLTGGSPFRQACLLAVEHPSFVVVAGLNTSGYAEIAYALDLKPMELAEMAMTASKESISVFHI
jgi:PTS system N-acetylgalactosamine-specific IIA component